MGLRDFLGYLFHRGGQQPGRRGYDRERATREEIGDMRAVQRRLKAAQRLRQGGGRF
jgi:hypothetical protein